jgi:hypothetical protein
MKAATELGLRFVETAGEWNYVLIRALLTMCLPYIYPRVKSTLLTYQK